MNYQNIGDIYSANKRFRDTLTATLGEITPDEATALPEGEKWSIQQIVEHLSMVDFGISRICLKLLAASRADGAVSDGSFALSANFGERAAEMGALKVEAPELVQPTGDVDIAKALSRMEASRDIFDSMKEDFEQFDFSAHKFPHPFFGDLTAGEWLVMAGLHQHRHAGQIEKLVERIRKGHL